MRSTDHRTDDPFAGLRPPRPPSGLRAQALAAAGSAGTGLNVDLWFHLWTNRPLRLAWAVALVVLVAGHLVVPGSSSWSVPAVGWATTGTVDGFVPEIAEIIDLPRIDGASLNGLP